MRFLLTLVSLCITVSLLSACGDSSRQEILMESKGADTRMGLKKSLGEPDSFGKIGAIEKWTYHANDGTVTFVLVGDKVTTSVTSNQKTD